MNQSKTLIFFGNERILSGVEFDEAPVLTTLLNGGYKIAAVIIKNNETKSRKIKNDVVANIANKNNIPLYISPTDDQISELVSTSNPEAAVLVAYGKIISQRVIDLFPKGIINIHPSSLPKYRGSSPIETAIANGDNKIGVSLISLTAGMDSGPVYTQQYFEITDNESKYEIGSKALQVGATVLLKNLPLILSGELKATEQDESLATFTSRLNKSQSRVDLSAFDSDKAYNLLRSMDIFPRVKLNYGNVDIIVTKFHISDTLENLSFKCADNKYITVDELVAPSGKIMAVSDFLRGYTKN
jgi:methionyl-tRNA formyltransferase